MVERLLPRHHAVAAAEHPGRGAARGRERLKAEPGQDPRRARVLRVGEHEVSRLLVQRTETIGLFELAGWHAGLLAIRVVRAVDQGLETGAGAV